MNDSTSKNLTPVAARFIAAIGATVLLAGGSLAQSAARPIAPQGGSVSARAFARPSIGNPMPPCAVRVWVSTQSGNTVLGKNATGTTCFTLTGAPGSPFNATLDLATDANGYLYVTDALNHRIVVFDAGGNYWSTLTSSAGQMPWGVCVSSTGIVASTTINGNVSNVDFFTSKGASNSVSAPSNSVPLNYPAVLHCAFDKRGDFFSTGYGLPILYLRNYNVNVANAAIQVCNTSPCTMSNGTWRSMYSHIRPGTVNTLSVVDEHRPDVTNFRVNLGSPNQLVFSLYQTPITLLSGYSSQNGYICQAAPTAGQGNASKIYLGDCSAAVDYVTNVTYGGPVSLFSPVTYAWGVATEPTGQY